MRSGLIVFLFAVNSCFGQQGWEIEIMPGVAGYSGDLTQHAVQPNTAGPAINVNLKYNTGGFVSFRGGIAWGKVSGNDKYNTDPFLKARNLNFKTFLWEANLCLEVYLSDPEIYYSYPYFFGGVGVFHFNPYTTDSAGKKTYLRPLSTGGEGLPEYPNIKPYSLTQICLPFGVGWKVKVHEDFTISFEVGIRYLFTPYLDDVSGAYIDPKILLKEKGPLAVALAFRQTPQPVAGDIRGGTKNDKYAFVGVKFGFYLNRKK